MLVVFSPRLLAGDTDEISTPVVFFAVPLVVAGTGLGALLGLLAPAPAGRTRTTTATAPVVVLVAGGAVVLGLWTVLWATGATEVPPLGIG